MGFVTEIILPIALALIMLSLGLGLTIADFTRVARQPRDFLIGAASQVILLPLVAFAFASWWSLSPEIALGIMLIAAAPGGITSNLFTSFGRGDVALSISLTAIISLLGVVTIPFIVVFAHGHFIGGDAGDISVAQTALSVFLLVTVPVAIGVAIRRCLEGPALRIHAVMRRVAIGLFVLVLAGAIFQEHENAWSYLEQSGPVTLALNVVMMVLAFMLAWAFATGPRQRVAISLECGVQNGTLAIAVGSLLFQDSGVVVPAATYSILSLGTALIFVGLVRTGLIQAKQ